MNTRSNTDTATGTHRNLVKERNSENASDLSYFLFNSIQKEGNRGPVSARARSRCSENEIFTEGTVRKMESGQLPDLWKACHQLVNTVRESDPGDTAIQMVPVMQRIESLAKEETVQFLKNPETRHVLVAAEQVEIVLIHWKPGKASDIHAHPGTGCLFKLLQGKLEELRYTPEPSPKLLGFNSLRNGNMAYIDDRIAHHQVGNPYGTSAISLHVYFKQ